MKRKLRNILAVVLPVFGVSFLIGSCANTPSCNNDACDDRSVSSVDPYKKGEIATWGTEKKVADQEDQKEAKFKEFKLRD